MRRILGVLAILALLAGFAFGQGLQQQFPIPLPPTMGGTNAVASNMVCDGDVAKAAANTTALTNAITTANGKKSILIYNSGTGACYANPFTISVAATHLVIDQGATLKLNANQALAFFIKVDADNVLIDLYGTIDGNKSNQSASVAFSNALILQNVSGSSNFTLDGHSTGTIQNSKAGVAFFTEASRAKVINTNFTGNGLGLSGAIPILYFNDSPYPTVSNNTFLDNLDGAMLLGGPSTNFSTVAAQVTNNVIDYSNVLKPAESLAISLFGGAPYATVSGNYVKASDNAGSASMLAISLDATDLTNAGTRYSTITGNSVDGGANKKISYGYELIQLGAVATGNVCNNVDTCFSISGQVIYDTTITGNFGSNTTGSFVLTSGAGATSTTGLTVTGNTCLDCATSSGGVFLMNNNYVGNATFIGNRVTFSAAVARDVPVLQSAGTTANGSKVVFSGNIINSLMASNSPTISWSGGTSVINDNDIFSTANVGTAITLSATVSESNIQSNRIVGYQYPWNTSAAARTTIMGNKVGATTPAGLTAASDFSALNVAVTSGVVSGLPLTNLTGLGTGVATALGVNVGSAGAPVTFNGALGSPSSAGTIPAHTLGGTISGGGNQINNVIIGTTTPLAGAFTTLSATGDGSFGNGTAANSIITVNPTTFGSGYIQFKQNSVNKWAPGVGVSGGNSNFEIYDYSGSAGVRFSITSGTGAITMSGLTTASGTPSSICQNTATKEITVNAALTCTVSSIMFKHDIALMQNADSFDRIEPVLFTYNASTRERWGFIAEQVASVDPKFGDAYDADGRPRSIDQNAILAATVKRLQQLVADNDNLAAEVKELKRIVNEK